MRKLLRNGLLAVISLIAILGVIKLCYSQGPDQPVKPASTKPVWIETAVRVSFTETNADTPVTQSQAVTIARGLLGVAPEAQYTARLGRATDNTIPFLQVADRLAWEITFDNLAVTFPGAEGPKPEFSTITCLLDAQTGALLKVSTPAPATGAVFSEQHPGALATAMANSKTSLAAMPADQLAQATVKPLIPLLLDLEKQVKDTIQPAKQLVAYFGLFTDRRPSRNMVDRPFWIVMTAGLHYYMPSTFGTFYATDTQFFINASSGKLYFHIIGPGIRE